MPPTGDIHMNRRLSLAPSGAEGRKQPTLRKRDRVYPPHTSDGAENRKSGSYLVIHPVDWDLLGPHGATTLGGSFTKGLPKEVHCQWSVPVGTANPRLAIDPLSRALRQPDLRYVPFGHAPTYPGMDHV